MAEVKTPTETLSAIKKAFGTRDYAKVLEIRNGCDKERFFNSDWEIIHRFAAAAAFRLGGGLSGQNKEMLELARAEAASAVNLGAAHDMIPENNYFFSLALYTHILYGLSRKEKAFELIKEAIRLNEDICDLPAALAAMLVQDQKFNEAIPAALSAVGLAQKADKPEVKGSALWYLGLAYKGLGDNKKALEHMQEALDIYVTLETGDNANVAFCVDEAETALKKLAE